MATSIDFEEEMRKMQEKMKSLMDAFLQPPMVIPKVIDEKWIPDMDVFETEDALYIIIDAAGLNKDEIDITLEGDMLHIKGQRRQLISDVAKKYYQMELHYGPFVRSYRLPCRVDEEGVSASYEDGILTIKLPKKRPVIKTLR